MQEPSRYFIPGRNIVYPIFARDVLCHIGWSLVIIILFVIILPFAFYIRQVSSDHTFRL